MSPRLSSPRLRRTLLATAAFASAISVLSAGALLNITPQPAGGSSGVSLPADPNAQPPSIPHLAIRLAPGHADETRLTPLQVTESGRVLLALPTHYSPPNNTAPIIGYRWYQSALQQLDRPAAQANPYYDAYGFTELAGMNTHGVVVGSYSHFDQYDGRWVSSDLTYVSTAAFWPTGESTAQNLPSPSIPSPLWGGFRANYITDSGAVYGRQLSRGRPPLHSESYYITPENGLYWPSVTATPARLGSNWAGNTSIPEIIRKVIVASSQNTHTIAQVNFRFYTSSGYGDSSRSLPMQFERDGITLNNEYPPVAINESGRWLTHRSSLGPGGYTVGKIHWADDNTNLVPLEPASAKFINDANDIFGYAYPGYYIWKWLPDPANPPAYHYVKHRVAVSMPTGWEMSGFEGRGFTTSGLLTGKIRKTHDDLGQPLPSNQQTTAPVLFVPVKMTWESLNANLVDENPNEGGGKRYFAGKLLPTETEPGNVLSLKIKIPTQQGAQIKLRAFDVDDATPTSFDTAGVIDTNGDAGGDNQIDYLNTPQTGQFIQGSSLSDTIIVTLDENAEAVIQFKVGMQPGSNYRVVAALNSSLGNFDQLQAVTTGALFVPAIGDQISGFTGSGALSPMLTVWRKLYIEQDSMAAVPTPRPYPDRAQLPSVLAWAVNDPVGRTTISEGSVHQVSEGYYNDGFISNDVDGQKFTVEHYYAAPNLRIIGLPTAQQQNAAPWWIEDDDGLGLNGPILPRFNLLNESVITKFKPAFIVPVPVEPIGLNPTADQTVDFDNNLTEADETYNTSPANSKENLRPYAHDNAFWNQLLVAGYQGPENADGDPSAENPLEGINIDNLFSPPFAVAYLEGIRETQRLLFASGDPVKITNANILIQEELDRVVAHEIAHSPQGNSGIDDHDEGALMDSEYVSPSFSPLSISRLRQTPSWR